MMNKQTGANVALVEEKTKTQLVDLQKTLELQAHSLELLMHHFKIVDSNQNSVKDSRLE